MVARREKDQSLGTAKAILIGIILGCIIASLFTTNFNNQNQPFSISNGQVASSSSIGSSSPSGVKIERDDEASLEDAIADLKIQVEELDNKLQLAEKARDVAHKQVSSLCKQQKAGPIGAVKALTTNLPSKPDNSGNPILANLSYTLAINKELIVTLVNSKFKSMLELWITGIKRVGITNYLVIALDDRILDYCEANNVPVYRTDVTKKMKPNLNPNARKGDKFVVSGFKFQILREFLQLGYSVLLSDVDIVFLQNPFGFLHRDSDIEAMSDGHDNKTAYGFNEFVQDPSMGRSTRFVYTSRIWAYNSGFFYIRPTVPAIELLDRVTGRLSQDPSLWDQAVFHEELVTHSHPGYVGLYASKRVMDIYQFMNSKVLFRFVRKDAKLRGLKPVVVHVNYHSDKIERMRAIVEFYVQGKHNALDSFWDGSWW